MQVKFISEKSSKAVRTVGEGSHRRAPGSAVVFRVLQGVGVYRVQESWLVLKAHSRDGRDSTDFPFDQIPSKTKAKYPDTDINTLK